jgi:CIC family chloride channel protein
VLGLAGAAAALLFNVVLHWCERLFLHGVAGYVPLGLSAEGGSPVEIVRRSTLWLIPVVTTIGGLIVGILTTWIAPEAEGHGTDAVVRSFHREGGILRARLAPLKLLTSAITIGSGGSAGREGPIAMVAAALGSWYAQLTKRDESERRLLLLVGAAAGISAIFRSPIGASLFAVEVLYADMEFEASVLLYATLGAIVAYATAGLLTGFGALFVVPQPIGHLSQPIDYAWYAVLGIAAGLIALLLPVFFYRVRDLFRALPVHSALHPAIGGLVTGLIGMRLPQLLGGGYGWMQRAIDGQLALGLLVALVFGKIITLSFTVGSGGSGGVFAPSLYIGAMLGGALAAAAKLPAAAFVVVGMAAVFAGSAHVPFATMMMVVEMTGGYSLLVPAALAVTLSYLVQTRLSRHLQHRSIYEAQVRSRADSPAHHNAHLEIALRILREKRLTKLDHLGEVDLVAVLRTGLAVEIGDGTRIVVRVVRETSALVNTEIGSSALLRDTGVNIIGILRGQHMLAPRPDLALLAGDRLILVAQRVSLDALHDDLAAW